MQHDIEAKPEVQNPLESQRYQSHVQLQLNQISHPMPEPPMNNISKIQNVFNEREFDFVSDSAIFSRQIATFLRQIRHLIIQLFCAAEVPLVRRVAAENGKSGRRIGEGDKRVEKEVPN